VKAACERADLAHRRARDDGEQIDRINLAHQKRNFVMNDLIPKADSLATKGDLLATKADLELAVQNLTALLTIRLGSIIVAGFAAIAVLEWIDATCFGTR